MSQMAKANITLTENHLRELAAIEKETDAPRARIIRRAISEYLQRYKDTHPEFAKRFPTALEDVEVIYKPGLKIDTVVIGGKKREVIVIDGGWRMPTPDDYESGPVQSSILDDKNG